MKTIDERWEEEFSGSEDWTDLIDGAAVENKGAKMEKLEDLVNSCSGYTVYVRGKEVFNKDDVKFTIGDRWEEEFGAVENKGAKMEKLEDLVNNSCSCSEPCAYSYTENTPEFYTPNKQIGCEPFPDNVVEKEIRNGIAIPKQKGKLQALKVLYGQMDGMVRTGYTVYVRSERATNSAWGKEVFNKGETKFILVPEGEILLVETA